MICEYAPDSFFITWALLTAAGLGSVVAMSAAVFYRYYVNPCFEDWRFKTQPKVNAHTRRHGHYCPRAVVPR
jgi:hypothetical protein